MNVPAHISESIDYVRAPLSAMFADTFPALLLRDESAPDDRFFPVDVLERVYSDTLILA